MKTKLQFSPQNHQEMHQFNSFSTVPKVYTILKTTWDLPRHGVTSTLRDRVSEGDCYHYKNTFSLKAVLWIGPKNNSTTHADLEDMCILITLNSICQKSSHTIIKQKWEWQYFQTVTNYSLPFMWCIPFIEYTTRSSSTWDCQPIFPVPNQTWK